MFSSDCVHVWASGTSCVQVTEGTSEVGTLGTMLYTLPNALVIELLAQQHWFAASVRMPAAWAHRSWTRKGTRVPGVVGNLRERYRCSGALPPPAVLQSWPDLEASVTRMLDLKSGGRIVAVLHAEDPVFVASSEDSMQSCLEVVAAWANRDRAAFYVREAKTVYIVLLGVWRRLCATHVVESSPTGWLEASEIT